MNAETGGEAGSLDREFLDQWCGRWLEAWNAHDVGTIVSMCSDDVWVDDPALPSPVRGHAGIRAFATDTFEAFPDLRLEGVEPPCPSRSGAGAWFPYRFTGTLGGRWRQLDIAPTGARVDFRGVTEWRFHGDLLSRWETTYDNLEAARQMGLVPKQGGRADRLFAKLQHLQAWGQRRANAA
jgi:hypothetical protein